MNEINIQNTINKLKSADSYHTQREYALDDEAIEMAVKILENVKNGELVEVVRCKDCRDWNEENRFNGTKVCGFWSSSRNHVYTEPDEFCSCGERR